MYSCVRVRNFGHERQRHTAIYSSARRWWVRNDLLQEARGMGALRFFLAGDFNLRLEVL